MMYCSLVFASTYGYGMMMGVERREDPSEAARLVEILYDAMPLPCGKAAYC